MGAAFEVYSEQGCGMAEEIHQQSLEVELGLRNIGFVSKAELDVYYKNNLLNTKYRPDLLVFGEIVVEHQRELSPRNFGNHVARVLRHNRRPHGHWSEHSSSSIGITVRNGHNTETASPPPVKPTNHARRANTMSIDPVTAQMLLLKCTGDEIWSVETCRKQGVPEAWIDELQGAFESGFDTDRNTIYKDGHVVNQYHGVLDLHLAYKLAEFVGIDWKAATATALGRRAEVSAIKRELDEL